MQTLGLLTPLVTIIGILAGGWWTASTLILALGIYPILDLLLGDSSITDPLEESKTFDFIVHTHGILVPVVIATLLYQAYFEYSSFIWLAAASVGMSSGASGIITAHELGHRRPKSHSWWLSRLDLMCVLYLHFTVEHNYTHHKHWAQTKRPNFFSMEEKCLRSFLQDNPITINGSISY